MRKHLYLIVEHDDEQFVGNVKFTDSRLNNASKNQIGPIQKFNKETGEFYTVGKQVGLGYYDFQEDEYTDNDAVADVIHGKLAEIDEEYLERADVELEEIAA